MLALFLQGFSEPSLSNSAWHLGQPLFFMRYAVIISVSFGSILLLLLAKGVFNN